MTLQLWIALFGILATSVTGFGVAYLHRKQMRQIELHRTDSSVPLKPPPHPFATFLRKYGADLFTAGFGIFWLVRGFNSPLTHQAVLDIALGVGNLVLSMVSVITVRILDFILIVAKDSVERDMEIFSELEARISQKS